MFLSVPGDRGFSTYSSSHNNGSLLISWERLFYLLPGATDLESSLSFPQWLRALASEEKRGQGSKRGFVPIPLNLLLPSCLLC